MSRRASRKGAKKRKGGNSQDIRTYHGKDLMSSELLISTFLSMVKEHWLGSAG